MEKILIKFLEWLREESRKQPMKFETDDDDTAMMFIEYCKLKEVHFPDVIGVFEPSDEQKRELGHLIGSLSLPLMNHRTCIDIANMINKHYKEAQK